MGSLPLRYPQNSTFTEADRPNLRYALSSLTFVGVGVVTNANAPIRCDETQVAIIDEVVITARTNDAATNVTCTLHVNGATINELGAPATVAAHALPFHFPGLANAARSRTLTLRPRGNLVVKPSSTLWVQSNTAGAVSCHIKYRHKPLSAALRDGDLKPDGAMPQVASTNSVAGGGTAAATSKNIIPGVAGTSIEVLGIYLTGHNYNAAADNIRLGFWDGTTGTFAANGTTIFRGWAQGAVNIYSPEVLIDDTRGCIQGAIGDGVYIEASANMAGATPTADFNVLYRRVPALEVVSQTGAPGATATRRKKFWVVTETDVTANIDTPFFAAPGANDQSKFQMVKVHGHAGSFTHAANAANSIAGLTVGVFPIGATISEMYLIGDDEGGPTACSTTYARYGLNQLVRLDLAPALFCLEGAADIVTNRCQLAWGTFGSLSDSATRNAGIA